MTIEELKVRTNVTDSQLDTEIEEADMILLAVHFDNVETLSVQLRLTAADRQFVRSTKDTRTAVDKALRLWRKANPGAATYRALLEIVLGMGVNGMAIAEEVCKFSALKCEHHKQVTPMLLSPSQCDCVMTLMSVLDVKHLQNVKVWCNVVYKSDPTRNRRVSLDLLFTLTNRHFTRLNDM